MSLASMALAGEFALRLAPKLGIGSEAGQQYNQTTTFSADARLIWELDPANPLVSADGLRDRDYALEKPPGTLRIVAVGDSVTYGAALPLEDTYTKRLESLLDADADGRTYEVINLGVGGYNTRQELVRYETKGRKYRPDLLVIGYVLNDVVDEHMVLGNMVRLRERGILRRSKLVDFLLNHLGSAPDAGGQPAFISRAYKKPTNWSIVSDSFREFERIAHEDGIPVLVVIFPFLDDLEHYAFGRIHRQVRREAERHGFEVLDLLDAFRRAGTASVRHSRVDLWHPGPAGHAVAAESIHAFLRSRWPEGLAGPAPS